MGLWWKVKYGVHTRAGGYHKVVEDKAPWKQSQIPFYILGYSIQREDFSQPSLFPRIWNCFAYFDFATSASPQKLGGYMLYA